MRVLMALGVVMVFANTAHARQDGLLEVGGAAGYAKSLHGDLDFGDVAVSGSARVRLGRFVAFEGHVSYWQHTAHDTFRIASATFESRTARRFPSVAANVLAIADGGARVAPYGGAGVGVFYHFSQYEQSGPHTFPYDRSDWRVSMGAQLVGGVDVRVARRLKAYGEFRFDLQSFQDPGSSSTRVLGGLRVPIG
jgi:hypothetical protein